MGIRLRRLAKEGKIKLILVEPRHTKLAAHAAHWLAIRPGADLALINGMLHVLVVEGLVDDAFIEKHTKGFDVFKKTLKKYTPAYTAKITGLNKEQIIEAALLYGSAQAACILYGMGITQHAQGSANIQGLVNLVLAAGNLGSAGCGLNPVRGQCNSQGVADMGVLPDFLPGYQGLDDADAIKKFQRAWGVNLSSEAGLSLTDMLPAVDAGRIRGMYIVGEDRVIAGPEVNKTRKTLSKLDFLVVQDIFSSQTTEIADVVLPGASFAEKDGTYTNTERHVQLLKRAIMPQGDSRLDWWIISQVSSKMGYPMNYTGASDIMRETAQLTPIYGGITYERLKDKSLAWPCPDASHPGTDILYKDGFLKGKVEFVAAEYKKPSVSTSNDYPYLLTTGKWLLHYHSGVLNQWSEGWVGVPDAGIVEIGLDDADKLGIGDEDWVTLESSSGSIRLRVKISEGSPSGMLFVPVHFRQAAVNALFSTDLDSNSSIPELKMCAVNIKPEAEAKQ